MTAVKVWKSGQAGQPQFPADFTVIRKAVLQVTDIKSNHNKFYSLELHAAEDAMGKFPVRLFTHYGRTDDLETNPDGGQKECRYFGSIEDARSAYEAIYAEKTGPRKGYREVSLASSRIGSEKARGTSAGEVDAKTLEKLAANEKKQQAAPAAPRVELHPGVQELVRYIYAEATDALTSTVAAKITANGIETPLGILTIGQIEKGEAILSRIYELMQKGKQRREELEELSGEFYTVVPHRIGRTRDAVAAAVIDSVEAFGQKQETLQLMKDMLQVNGAEGQGSVLYDAQVGQQYLSLKCDVGWLDRSSDEYKQIERHVTGGKRSRGCWDIEVKNVFKVRRSGEWDQFAGDIDNQRLLFHGSRIQNWVGILSRGILLPKVVVKLGVRRTDAGWLGNGIYFGDVAETSCAYTSPGRKGRGTRLMALARVALGREKQYRKITYGLTAPPQGYHSCHGVKGSEFYDDEFVVYDTRQQRIEYLVEFGA